MKCLKLFVMGIFLVTVVPVFSQISVGSNLAFPSGHWSDWGDEGFGVSASYEGAVHSKLNWSLSVGTLVFIGRNYDFGVTNAKYYNQIVVPITGGLKYYFLKESSGFYGAADLGLFFGNNNQGMKIGFSPGVGYRLKKFDFSLRANLISNLSYWGIRAAYTFPSKLNGK